MPGSVREYAILYVGGKLVRGSSGGGNVMLNAGQHALDGPEHTGQLPADRVSVEDAGAYFAGDDAEAVLQELGADIVAIEAELAAGVGTVFSDETQVVQARRYLMSDGTFRDPFITGLGTLTVGAITTIADDTKYNAWPSIARMRDNQIILVYTKGDSHHQDETGKAVGRIGTEGLNGAITWGSEFTIYDDPSVWVSAVGVAVLSTGRVIVSGFYGAYASNPLDGVFIVSSDDAGATWGSIVVVNSTLTSFSYGSGRTLELPNGELLQCVEGKNSGDTFSRMVVLRSTDQGETWGSQVTIATGTRNYYEACLGLLDDDTILVLLRTSDADGDIYQATSSDGGATWTTPALAFAGHGQPNWTQLSTGTLIAITRENAGGGVIGDVWAYTSIDGGTTWSSPTTLDGTMYEMEYGSPLELLDGRLLVVYGFQPSSPVTNADIKQVYVTEAVTSSASSSPTGAAGGDLSGTYPNPSVVDDSHSHTAATLPAAAGSGGVSDHVHVVAEAHTSDGSTTAFLLDNEFDEGSVAAYNLTSGLRLTVTETLPRTATIGAAGTAGNVIAFDYIPVTA